MQGNNQDGGGAHRVGQRRHLEPRDKIGCMPFRSHLDILNLEKLPIESIRAFSLATDDREQDAIAKNVLRNYGLPGLRTLWLCQGLNCSARGVSVEPAGRVGITRATLWWLTSSSDEATAIKADFASVQNMNDANLLLSM